MDNKVLILIPAYNEEQNISKLLTSLLETDITSYADILVINDASSDTTSVIAKKLGVNVVTHVFNLGYGSALQIGYKYAVRGHYDYVIQLDADGQHDICNIPKIYEALKKEDSPDIILCSRFVEGSVSFDIPSAKKYAIKYFRKLIKICTGEVITDPTSGLQGLKWDAFLFYSKYGNFDSQYPDANMIVQMLRSGFTIKEFPCVMHERTEGESMHSGILRPIGYMFLVTLSTAIAVLKTKKRGLKKARELRFSDLTKPSIRL